MIVQSVAQKLAAAETALHNLRIGKASIEVEVDGRRVRYQHTDVEKLQGYVNQLRLQADGRPLRPGAIGVLFG